MGNYGPLLPDYEFIVCQDKQLSKDEYHELLGKAKIVFSANLQETLGISAYEGCLVDTLPLVPNRLSYYEMYPDEMKYASALTVTLEGFEKSPTEVVDKIKDMVDNYDKYIDANNMLKDRLKE